MKILTFLTPIRGGFAAMGPIRVGAEENDGHTIFTESGEGVPHDSPEI